MIVVVPTQRQDSPPDVVVVPTHVGQESLPESVVVPTHGGRNRCQRLLLCRHMGAGFAARECCCADTWGQESLSETAAQDSSAGFTVYETVVVPT